MSDLEPTPEQSFDGDIAAEVARMEAVIDEVDNATSRFGRELTSFDAIDRALEAGGADAYIGEFVSDMAVHTIIAEYGLGEQYDDPDCTVEKGKYWETTMRSPRRDGIFVAKRAVENDRLTLFYRAQ
jgi:hypothetical protein